jgi:phosphate transport system substrate-binding protein
MGNSVGRITLALALCTLPVAVAAQSAQVRAVVSSDLPHYTPNTQLKAVLDLPGTDALSDLGDEWNHHFRQFHPDARINYMPKLSKECVEALTEGAAPLVITAREMTPEETKAFQAKHGYIPMRIPICTDATIVFVHKSNPLTSITMEQLDAIYSKDRLGGAAAPITTWSDLKVRGDLGKRPINAYARAEGAATREHFKQAVLLKGEFRPGIIPRQDAMALAESVVTDETGIAFGSLSSWYAGVKVLPIVPYQASDARFPNQENITTSKYPMPRLYYAYLNRVPGKPLDPAVNEVLHFLLSQEGQGDAADTGIIPAPVEFLTIALKRLDR